MTGFVLSHSGRQHSYRVALALQHANALDAFLTSMYYKRERFPDALLRALPPFDRWMRKRWQEGLDPGLVVRRPLMELPEIAARAAGVRAGGVRRLVEQRDMRFDEWAARRIDRIGSRVAWGFQGSCFETLGRARALGMSTVIEMASLPPQVIRGFLERAGATHETDESDEYRLRNDGEAARADWCVAASTFCAQALVSVGVPRDRIQVIPLGVDVRKFVHGERRRTTVGPLRVLFAGKLAVHKGISFLLAAVRRFGEGEVSLTLAGPSVGQESQLGLDASSVHVLGQIDDMRRVYAEHDVMVLPSLYEGFGLVVVEAMACGLPVIATTNSCAPDVVREGVDGFLVPAFDSDAIAQRLDWMLLNRERLVDLGRNAAQRAMDFTWDAHAVRVKSFARGLLERSSR
jgi:glycosyltransferase involved in cell wall biosynthesis